jgi:hypothetical protein
MKIAIYAVISVVAVWLVSATNAQENATHIPLAIRTPTSDVIST